MVELSHTIPDIKRLEIGLLTSENSSLNQFLKECAPASKQTLSINHNSFINKCLADPYSSGLEAAVSGVIREVFLSNLVMGKNTFEMMIRAVHRD